MINKKMQKKMANIDPNLNHLPNLMNPKLEEHQLMPLTEILKIKLEVIKNTQNKENNLKEFLKNPIPKIDKVEELIVVSIRKKMRKGGGGTGNYGTI